MIRVNQIIEHPYFKECIDKNRLAETQRRFCHHNMEHFLDVARIARIINFEEKLELDNELIYATALLHDIGRWMQYEKGVDHDVASGDIARKILPECGFTEKECHQIINAILGHRKKEEIINLASGNGRDNSNEDVLFDAKSHSLEGLIKRADKLSRPCFNCEAKDECNWSEEKMNLSLIF